MTAAAFVNLLVAAVEAFSMMVSAFMSLTVVVPAFVAFPVMMAVVVAFGIGIILQRTLCQSLRGRIGRTGDPAVKLDACFGQRCLRAHSNAAADQRIYLCCFQETSKRAMTAAVGDRKSVV